MSYISEVLADTPRWYYRFNEPSGSFADSSGNGVVCSESGTVTRGVAGAKPNFTGITCGPGNSLSLGFTAGPSTSQSIEGWFKTTTSSFARIEQNRASVGVCLQMGIGNGGLGGVAGTVDLYFNTTSFWQGKHTNATVNDGLWHHIVGVWTGGTVTAGNLLIYVDGVLAASTNDSGNTGSTGSPITGQGAMTLFDQGVTISAHDVAFYHNVALSAGRVAAHYAAGMASPHSFGVLIG